MAPSEVENRRRIHEEYMRHKDQRSVQAEALARLDTRIAHGRFVLFLTMPILAVLWLYFQVIPWYLVPVPAPFFAALVIWHERVSHTLQRARRGISFYERGLARLENRWSGHGQPGNRFIDESHPNALDLDLFGTGSLYELLCTARTRMGEDVLARWLLAPAVADEVRSRQEAVAELRKRLDLREAVSLLSSETPQGVDLAGLVAWGEATPRLTASWIRWLAFILAWLAAFALSGWLLGDVGGLPFLVVLLIEAALWWHVHERVTAVLGPIERRARDLGIFAGLLSKLESEPFQSARLRSLQEGLKTEGIRPSQRIVQLSNMIDWLNARRNQLFILIAPALMWGTQWSFALERWRAAVGPAVSRWLEMVGELEALLDLAAYSYENPNDPFPELVPDGPHFEGMELGHPLLPIEKNVRNNVRLAPDQRLLVISGSNMSGKSTLLRTVGINAVLAQAGAPVRATQLRLSFMQVGATLRIQDSLAAGRSRFFTEILRIRQLVELAQKTTLLFLLDELLQGTNSHDRRLGAEAIVRQLLKSGAIGLITTHDLALTHIADQLAPVAVNVHFEDHFENEEMTFDYRMRPGVVQKSNALALMRAVGIAVNPGQD